MGLSFAELPEGLCFPNPPAPVQNDQLSAGSMILALQETKLLLTTYEHRQRSFHIQIVIK